MIEPETWKPFLNNCAISSWGRFYNFTTEQFVSGYIHKSRAGFYRRIELEGKRFMAHIEVCKIFHGDMTEFYSNLQVNHIDGNTLNNRTDNLEWVTQSNNVKYWHKLRQKPNLDEIIRVLINDRRKKPNLNQVVI